MPTVCSRSNLDWETTGFELVISAFRVAERCRNNSKLATEAAGNSAQLRARDS